MKKHFFTLIALTFVFIFIAMGTVQASQSILADGSDVSGISSAYPLNRWTTDYISTYLNAGSDVSIAFDPDHDQAAWVSYYNASFNSLWVAHYVGVSGGNCGPESTWYCVQVDQAPAETKGWSTSIDVFPDINPNPLISTWKVGISYYDVTNKSLKYAQYRCPPLNPCFWTISTVFASSDPSDEIGRFSSLKFNSTGSPNIALFFNWGAYTSDAVFLAYPTASGDGNCGDAFAWQCDKVDQFVSLGPYLSMDIDWNDNVYIAYYDGLIDKLKYAYYAGIGDCWLDNGWICQYIDDTPGVNVGLFPSLHAPQNGSDTLRVAYYDSTNGTLKYAYARQDTLGNCSPGHNWQCTTINDMGVGLAWASISLAVDDNNKPMIAYTDAHEDLAPLGLKIAEPAYGMPYANCSGTILYDWYCGNLDNGNAYVDDGKFVSLGIKPSGLAMVVYSEQETDYPGNYDLKFAYQMSWSFLPLTQK
jgi:hypothetical protein